MATPRSEQGRGDRCLSFHGSDRRTAFAHELYLKNVPLIPRIMTSGPTPIREWTSPGAQIGSYFLSTTAQYRCRRNHGYRRSREDVPGVVGCQIAGRRSVVARQKRHPTISDHVTIYAGATIMAVTPSLVSTARLERMFPDGQRAAHSLVIQEAANVKVMSKRDRQRTSDFNV